MEELCYWGHVLWSSVLPWPLSVLPLSDSCPSESEEQPPPQASTTVMFFPSSGDQTAME